MGASINNIRQHHATILPPPPPPPHKDPRPLTIPAHPPPPARHTKSNLRRPASPHHLQHTTPSLCHLHQQHTTPSPCHPHQQQTHNNPSRRTPRLCTVGQPPAFWLKPAAIPTSHTVQHKQPRRRTTDCHGASRGLFATRLVVVLAPLRGSWP